ncbi:hypothetical protein D3C87_2028030 [compost metagenome]
MVVISRPITDSHLAPILSKIIPVIGDIIPIRMAPGSSIRPDSIGVKPRMVCR